MSLPCTMAFQAALVKTGLSRRRGKVTETTVSALGPIENAGIIPEALGSEADVFSTLSCPVAPSKTALDELELAARMSTRTSTPKLPRNDLSRENKSREATAQ